MNGRLSNASLVVVLLVAFSLFVAGLTASTDGGQSVRGGPATPTPTRTPTPVQYGRLRLARPQRQQDSNVRNVERR